MDTAARCLRMITIADTTAAANAATRNPFFKNFDRSITFTFPQLQMLTEIVDSTRGW